MKSIIKLFYVIILPLAVSVSSISYLKNSADPNYLATIVLFTAVFFNAMFWLSHMNKKSIWPIISIQILPLIGVGIIVENTSTISDTVSLTIMLPFIAIEFKNRNKKYHQ